MKKTVEEIYKYFSSLTTRALMLKGPISNFWNIYNVNIDNFADYLDSYFCNRFKSFVYINGEGDIETVALRFSSDFNIFMSMNKQRYIQKYRIESSNELDYSIFDNYNFEEKLDKDTSDTLGSRTDSVTLGSRSDSVSNVIGEQRSSDNLHVSPYNNESFYNANETTQVKGSRTDSVTDTKGQQQNDTIIGSQSNSGTVDYTLTRKGAVNMPAPDVMKKHLNFWDNFAFYVSIIDDFAVEYLLTGDC